MFDFELDTSDMERRLLEFEKQSPKALREALEVAGLSFLDWANNGSTKESRKPPILQGFLRGSSSAFVGGKLIGVYEGEDNKDANRSHSDSPLNVTWGWNADYATKMHEEEYNPGPISQQDGDAGNKWLEKHLLADKEDWMALVALEFGRRLGTL
jgi:hypothetical protein